MTLISKQEYFGTFIDASDTLIFPNDPPQKHSQNILYR